TTGSAAVFLITHGGIEPIATVFSEAGVSHELLAAILRRADASSSRSIDRAGQERIAILASHLFATKNSKGVFIRLCELSDKSLQVAYRDLQKQPPADATLDDEGIMKELQADVSG